MNSFMCSLKAKLRDQARGNNLGTKERKKIADDFVQLAQLWDLGAGFDNAKKMRYNNWDTFEFVWNKMAGMRHELDPETFPITRQDVRKMKNALRRFDSMLGKPQGVIKGLFYLPKAGLRRVPELNKFLDDVTHETQFFRDFSSRQNKRVGQFLELFEGLNVLMSGGKGQARESAKFMREWDIKWDKNQKIINNKNTTPQQKADAIKESNSLLEQRSSKISEGAHDAYLVLENVLEGADIDTYRKDNGDLLSVQEKTYLKDMNLHFSEIRKDGVKSLIKSTQKLKQIAQSKQVEWGSGVLNKVDGILKRLEFQKLTDESGNYIDSGEFEADRLFQELGFKPNLDGSGTNQYSNNGKMTFRKYLPKYTLGIAKLLGKVEKAAIEKKGSDSDLVQEINNELKDWEGVIDRLKTRKKHSDSIYTIDPTYYMRKYINDVGMFNYRVHLKDSYLKAYETLEREHLKPIQREGDKELEDTVYNMMKQIQEVYSSVTQQTPDNLMTPASDLVNAFQALTYFRLLGGNIRSAARNATQRQWEFSQWGLSGIMQARAFYSSHGNYKENTAALARQQQKMGLEWFDPVTNATAGAFKQAKDWLMTPFWKKNYEVDLSQASRGALDEALTTDGELYVDANGELTTKEPSLTGKIKRGVQVAAGKSSIAHKIVEDWNRTKTFRTAFALAYEGMSLLSNDYIANKMSTEGKTVKPENVTQEMRQKWIENKSGRAAYNMVVDLHYEYANWAKARALQGPTGKFIGQFQHYKFNLYDMQWQWLKEAGYNIAAGDMYNTSVGRMLRYGMLRAIIKGGSILSGINIAGLATNDIEEDAYKAYLLLTTDRDDPKQMKKLLDETYGQGALFLAGPNVDFIGKLMSKFELFDFATSKDRMFYNESLSRNRTNLQKKDQWWYDTLSMVNMAAAREFTFTFPTMFKGGLSNLSQGFETLLGLRMPKHLRDVKEGWLKNIDYYFTKPVLNKQLYKPKKKSKVETDAILKSLDYF